MQRSSAHQPAVHRHVLAAGLALVVLLAVAALSYATGLEPAAIRLAWYTGPGISALLLALACGASRQLLAGIAAGAAAYLLTFYLWVHAGPPEALAWVLFLFATPGGWVAALLLCWLERRRAWPAPLPILLGAVLTWLGLVLAQGAWLLGN